MQTAKKFPYLPVSIPNVYTPLLGLVRALLAVPPLLTLIFTDPQYFLRPAAGATVDSICSGISSGGLFCLMGPSWMARVLAVVICLWVISGLLPWAASLLFVWLSFTLQNNNVVADGGDQILLNLSIWMAVLSIFDKRTTSWGRPLQAKPFAAAVGVVVICVIKIQFVILYLQSGIAKAGVETWADGTEVYYDINAPMLGSVGPVKSFLNYIFESPVLLQSVTWGTMAIEVFIAYAIVGSPWTKKISIFLVILLHSSIAVALGIVTFSLTMIIGACFALIPLQCYSAMGKSIMQRMKSAETMVRKNNNATFNKVDTSVKGL